MMSVYVQCALWRVLGDWLKLGGAALQQLLAEQVRATFHLASGESAGCVHL
jgi:hypothetical protein